MELVSITEAARRLGLSPHAVRRRLQSGQLHGRKEPTPQGHVWLVELPETGTLDSRQDDGQREDAPDGETQALRELVEVLREQVDRQHVELEARRREVAELHVLLQQAQRQLPAPQADGHQGQGTGRRRFWPWGGKTT